jgi:TRAP-type uncharacterized transport system substrate-binding protein
MLGGHSAALAMKLWLAQRLGGAGRTIPSAPAHAAGKAMESIEHLVRNRIRLFLRNTWLVTVLGTVILVGVVWLAFYLISEDTVMKVAAGPAGSVDVRLVEFLEKKFAHDGDGMKLALVTTSGPVQSAQAMADHSADLAILPADAGASADWPVVAIVRQNVMTFIVPAAATATPAPSATTTGEAKPAAKTEEAKEAKETKETKETKGKKGAKEAKDAKDAKTAKGKANAKEAKNAKGEEEKSAKTDEAEESGKLDKISQLAGQRIGVVTGNEATAGLLNIVLKHYGVPLDKVQVSQIEPKDIASAIADKQVDVLFVAGPAAGHAIGEAVAAATRNAVAPGFIEIDQADAIAKRDPAFDSINIEAGMFRGNPPAPADNLKTLSFPEYLVARKTWRHDGITTLARLVYSSRQALAAAIPGEVKIEAPSTDKDADVIVHPGALAYLNDDQKSFFEKYGDYIFYGLLIFPIFGSVIAGASSYFHRSGRTRRLRLLQRLIDIVRKAHAAPTLEALDQLQIDADNLLITILHQSEHDNYDETAQISFSLALDQVRFAIAARRAVLLEQGAGQTKTAAKAAAA